MKSNSKMRQSDKGLRLVCAGTAVALVVLAYLLQGIVDPRVCAFLGVIGFITLAVAYSTDIRSMAARIVLIAGGLALAYPEMASNIAGLAALPAAAILRRQSSD